MNIVMRRILILFCTVMILALTACDNFAAVPVVSITPHFEPTALGFEVDTDGTITITSHIVTFTSRGGSIGVLIKGYQVDYLDSAGNAIKVGDSTLHSSGSLAVNVPAGLICPVSEVAVECTINTPGVRFASQNSEPVGDFFTLPAPIAIEIINGNYVGAKANFFFEATTDLNRDVVIGPFTVGIGFPITGG